MIKSNLKQWGIKNVVVLAFLTFWIINILTPFNGDDYLYAFSYADGSRIDSMLDVFHSQYQHYLTINGRVIPHVLEQIFAGLSGKWLFNLFNAGCCTFLLCMIVKIMLEKLPQLRNFRLILIGITFTASLLLFSYPGQTMFWMAGSLNYMFPTLLALVVLKLFESDTRYHSALLFFFALLSGWCQEAISVPLSVSLWTILLFDKTFRTPKRLILVIGYTVGTFLIVCSPGTLARLSTNEIQHTGGLLFIFFTKVVEFNACLHELYIYWLTLLLIIFLLVTYKKHKLLYKYRNLLIVWVVNTLFFFALGFGHERITFFLSVISYILVLSLISEFCYHRLSINVNILSRILIIFMGVVILYSIKICYDYNSWNERLIERVVSDSQQHVVLKADNYDNTSKLIYAQKLDHQAFAAHNKGIAKYYHKTSVQFLDSQLYESIFQLQNFENDSTEILYRNVEYDTYKLKRVDDLYYIELPYKAFKEGIIITSHHKVDNGNLLPRQRIIRSILNTLDDGTSRLNHCMILLQDKCYCFIPRVPQNVESFTIKINNERTDLCSFERVDKPINL